MSDQLSQNLPDWSSTKFAGLVELYAADYQSEISFTIPRDVAMATIFVGFIRRTDGCQCRAPSE